MGKLKKLSKESKKKIIISVCIFFVLVVILLLGSSEEVAIATSNLIKPKTDDIIIEIKGEVNRAGIYSINSDARVNDVIILANGFTNNADTSKVNLAEKLEDGMVIIIPSIKKEKNESKININEASLKELMTLDGIGESKAEKIIKYREEKGIFNKINDIKNVNGISDALFEKIKDQITV